MELLLEREHPFAPQPWNDDFTLHEIWLCVMLIAE